MAVGIKVNICTHPHVHILGGIVDSIFFLQTVLGLCINQMVLNVFRMNLNKDPGKMGRHRRVLRHQLRHWLSMTGGSWQVESVVV